MSSTFVVVDHNKHPIQCTVDARNLHQFGLQSQLVSHQRKEELQPSELDERQGSGAISNGTSMHSVGAPSSQQPQVSECFPSTQYAQPQDIRYGNPNPQHLAYSMQNNYTAPQPMLQQIPNTHRNGSNMPIVNPNPNPMTVSQPPNVLPQVGLPLQCPPFNPAIAFTWLVRELNWFKTAIICIEQWQNAGVRTQAYPNQPVGSGQVNVPQPVLETSDSMSHAETTVTSRASSEEIVPAESPASRKIEQEATPVQISKKSVVRALRRERQKLRETQLSVADPEAKSVPVLPVSSKNAKKRAQKERKKNKAVPEASDKKDPSSNQNELHSPDEAAETPEVEDPSIKTAPAPTVVIERNKMKSKGEKDKRALNLATSNGNLSDAAKPSNCRKGTVKTPGVGDQESNRENSLAAKTASASALVTKESKKKEKKSKKSATSNENRTDEAVRIPDVKVPKSTPKDGADREASKAAQVSGTGLTMKVATGKTKKEKKKCTRTVINNENHSITLGLSKSPKEHHDQSDSTESPVRPDQAVNSPEVQMLDSVSPDQTDAPETKSDGSNLAYAPYVDPHDLSISSEVNKLEYSESHEPNVSENEVVFVPIQCAPENAFLPNQATVGTEQVANARTNKNDVEDCASETIPPETRLETVCEQITTKEVMENSSRATANLQSRVDERNKNSPSTSSTESHQTDVAHNLQSDIHELVSTRAMQLQFEELKKSMNLNTWYKTTWKPDRYLNDMAIKVLNYFMVMFHVRSNYAHLRPKDFVDPNLEEPTGLLKEIVSYKLSKPLFYWKNDNHLKRCQKYLEERINDHKGTTDPRKKKLHALYKMVSLSTQPHFNLEDIMYFCSKVTSRAEKRKMDERYLEMFEHVIEKHIRNEYEPALSAEIAYDEDNVMFALINPVQFLNLKKYLRTMFYLRNGLCTNQQKTEMIESLTPSQRKMVELGENIQSESDWSPKQTVEFLEKLMDSIETLEIIGEEVGKCYNLYMFLTEFESSIIDHDCFIYTKILKTKEGEYPLTFEEHKEILRPWFTALE